MPVDPRILAAVLQRAQLAGGAPPGAMPAPGGAPPPGAAPMPPPEPPPMAPRPVMVAPQVPMRHTMRRK